MLPLTTCKVLWYFLFHLAVGLIYYFLFLQYLISIQISFDFFLYFQILFFWTWCHQISFGVNEIIEIYTFNRTQMIYQIWRIKTILWIFILFSSFRSKITYFYFCLSNAVTFPSFPEYAFYLSNFSSKLSMRRYLFFSLISNCFYLFFKYFTERRECKLNLLYHSSLICRYYFFTCKIFVLINFTWW